VRSRHYVAPRMHALLTSVASARRTGAVFACQLAAPRLAFLRQHAVSGKPVLSAAALAEMAAAATRLLAEEAGPVALSALAVCQQLRLEATAVVTTIVAANGAISVTAGDGSLVMSSLARTAVDAVASAAAAPAAQAQPGGENTRLLARIVRPSPLLAAAAAASKPLAALRLAPGVADGFWTHPGLLSAALALADTCEAGEVGADVLLAAQSYTTAAAPADADIWASAVEADHASVISAAAPTASFQV